MRSALRKLLKSNKIKVLLLILLLLLLSIPVVMYIRFATQTRLVLREAKNVRLALQMYDIEAYAHNSTIFDGSRNDGMKDGLQQKIKEYLELDDCHITLTAYDGKEHKVLGFIYERKHFQIIYEYNKKTGDSYQFNYILKIKTYDGD